MSAEPGQLDTTAHLASWEANADAWIAAVRNRALPSRRITDAALLQRIAHRPYQSLLDIGCGEGWLLRQLGGTAGRRLMGVDACAALIEAAAAAQQDADFVCVDYDGLAQCSSLVGMSFDWIVFNFALFGAEADTAALGFALAHLAPEGRVLIQTLPGGSQEATSCETFAHLPGEWTPMPYQLRSPADWQRLCAAAGGQILDSTIVCDDNGVALSILMEIGP
ncbi:SAM-dependent methyltransferase [Algiphilus sp.]|uniref:SAM-dependent methyltransferase n=1 Tax=Algiphilus sp. TaxID=1872431 RepID=UPI003B523061